MVLLRILLLGFLLSSGTRQKLLPIKDNFRVVKGNTRNSNPTIRKSWIKWDENQTRALNKWKPRLQHNQTMTQFFGYWNQNSWPTGTNKLYPSTSIHKREKEREKDLFFEQIRASLSTFEQNLTIQELKDHKISRNFHVSAWNLLTWN